MKVMEVAAALVGRGWKDEDVCLKLGCTMKQLSAWRGREEFQRKCDEAYREEMRRLRYRTVDVLGRQLEGEESRAAQSAAAALVKLAADLEKEDGVVNVYFDQMPAPGAPKRREAKE